MQSESARSDNRVVERRESMEHLRAGVLERLRAVRNADGGWAYHPGKRSRIEPTCWALLALAPDEPQATDARRPRPVAAPGWLADRRGGRTAKSCVQRNRRADAAAVRVEPVTRGAVFARSLPRRASLPQTTDIRQDNSLQAWSWMDGTFSWVEPTAWCVLLLKQRLARRPVPAADERIASASGC